MSASSFKISNIDNDLSSEGRLFSRLGATAESTLSPKENEGLNRGGIRRSSLLDQRLD